MKELYESTILDDPATGQLVWEIQYSTASPPQSIRIPIHEAVAILIQELSGLASTYPAMIRAHPDYPELVAAIKHIGEPAKSA